MTIQRQYTLPHCNLVLQGLSANEHDPMSPLAVLMNVECHLPGATDATLTGGREFLNSLVAAVSRYGQQLLSGVIRPLSTPAAVPPMVDLKPGEGRYHHLIVQQQPVDQPVTDTDALPPLDIKLTTVQFYDLMEAVDQLLADTQTLPDLTAQFQAVPRRLVKPAEPMTKRAAPAAIGAAALAAAGLALFFVPPPVFEPSRPEQQTESSDGTDPLAGDGADNLANGDNRTDPDAAEAAVDRLEAAPAITDTDIIAVLRQDLANRLQEAWAQDPLPTEPLTYRMVVSEDGDILGYKYENEAALGAVDTTPLPQLTFLPVDANQPVQEAVAQFIATFTPEGTVVVEPAGRRNGAATSTNSEANSETAPGRLPTLGAQINDGDRIRTLNSTLYSSILDNLAPLSANEPLSFRVRLDRDGTVVGYEPTNAAAVLLAEETPLPGLVARANSDSEQADFLVVFTETGVLQVSPWDGWPQ
ncbi:MAG: DUF4335 domain-containing protein [Leptolyngbya sp. LCM1.Bin17]|nr:MAG: DUF4335 domain-containing protein [Leptolyngbya sp. LCM1.Bin17]